MTTGYYDDKIYEEIKNIRIILNELVELFRKKKKDGGLNELFNI